MDALFDKIWSMLTIAMGALVSYFMYGQKKMNDAVSLLDSRVDKLEIDKAEYNKSVDYLVKQFDRMEKTHDKVLEKIDKLVEKK